MSKARALYLHIPFCRRKCGYCSFVSSACRDKDIPVYLKALEAELAQRADGETLRSLFFGGGTPSLLSPAQFRVILGIIRSLFPVDEAAEITIEANPGTVNEGYLKAIRELGVNRLSLGVQSLNDIELALLGRIHTAEEARQAVKFARSAGFDNLNLDLIYGLPGQTLTDWRKTLGEALFLNPDHLSLYALTLEEDAPMLRDIESGKIPLLDADLAADQYELAEDLLAAAGFRHYEISNWTKPGYECRHNLVYWHNHDYIGAGVAAHSLINGHRLANTSNLDEYLTTYLGGHAFTPDMDEVIDEELRLSESAILGLRLNEGIAVDFLTQHQNKLSWLTEAELLEITADRIRLTRRGRLLSNEVFWRLLPDRAVAENK